MIEVVVGDVWEHYRGARRFIVTRIEEGRAYVRSLSTKRESRIDVESLLNPQRYIFVRRPTRRNEAR